MAQSFFDDDQLVIGKSEQRGRRYRPAEQAQVTPRDAGLKDKAQQAFIRLQRIVAQPVSEFERLLFEVAQENICVVLVLLCLSLCPR